MSTDVLVNSSVAASVGVEDRVQPVSLFRRMLESSLPVLAQLDRCDSMKVRPRTLRATYERPAPWSG